MRKETMLRAHRGSERGAALITSLFALLLVTLLGLSLVSIGDISVTISTNDRVSTEAMYIAEAGIGHACNLIFAAPTGYNGILGAGDGAAGTGDELSTQAADAITTAGVAFAAGRYVVRVSDDVDSNASPVIDTNGRIVVTSIGTGRDGATATIEVIIGSTSMPAMLVDGNLRINGNPMIKGSGGIIHSNAILDLDGTPCAEQFMSASMNVVDSDRAAGGAGCAGGGDARPSQEVIPVPLFDLPTDFRPAADFVLGRDGKVYRPGFTIEIADASSSKKWEHGSDTWDWDPAAQTWKLGGNTLVEATYYSEGNIIISGNPGQSESTPLAVTLIAEGYIEISGNVNFQPRLGSGGAYYSLIAGTDLLIGSNPTSGLSSKQGLHYATHQLKLSGNPNINGQVIVANRADTNSPGGNNPVPLLQGNFIEISGNPVITYNGVGIGNARIISWREVRS